MSRKLVLCDCAGSQRLDPDGIAAATGLSCTRVHTALCTTETSKAAEAMAEGNVIMACQQERQRFEDLAAEMDLPEPGFVDLRDRAGWSDETDATPKMAALAAEAAVEIPLSSTRDITSEGTCLIIGASDAALEAAADLADTLAVTVLAPPGTEAPTDRRFDLVRGNLRRASGSLGRFTVQIDALELLEPGGRGPMAFSPPRDGGQSECDILLDLSGAPSLFPAPAKRDGYLRADPGSLPAVARAVRDAAQLVGTFEKTLFLRYEPSLCAHSRAQKPACSRCLDACATGAITSAGDHVSIDPLICAGCAACASLCPSGAIAFDAPPVESTQRRLGLLASTFRKAGGTAPRLLVHDAAHGGELIRLAARFGRGLPADVIPLEVEALPGFGHAEMLAAIATGFAHVHLLLSPGSDRDTLTRETDLARAIAADRITLHDIADPDDLETTLRAVPTTAITHDPVSALGNRRQVTRLAARTLNPEDEILPLPDSAPYGAVLVDTEACTLCLSCVSLCPSGALGDNPDAPQLRFQEDACLQCGLCATICPEQAITLKPRLNLTASALDQVVLNEEEPFPCIECGALFGARSTIERITEKLSGKHAMFANPDAARLIQMCDNCRVNAQFHSQNNPFAGPERPRPRTTDDYLSKRRDH